MLCMSHDSNGTPVCYYRNDIDKTTQQFSTILERNGEIIKKITEVSRPIISLYIL